MPIRESTTIAADAERVWPFIADPKLHTKWNPKAVSVQRERVGVAFLNEQFVMTYRMAGKERTSQVEIAELEHARRIVFRHRMFSNGREQVMEERYEMKRTSQGVKVTQEIDLSRAGVPWYFRCLIWIITHLGKPVEEAYLHRLKRAVEASPLP